MRPDGACIIAWSAFYLFEYQTGEDYNGRQWTEANLLKLKSFTVFCRFSIEFHPI